MVRISFYLLIVLVLISCASIKKQPISYLGLQTDTAGLSKINDRERIIQKGDLLSIVVYSDNPVATGIYNQPLVNPTGNSPDAALALNPSTGYLVDNNGNIQFQSLGNVYVEGMSKQALSDSLSNKLKTYLVNPYCSIRLLNYRITVMGEVLKPNSYNVTNERINILEAIGMAGDISLYGRKDNVKVIREINNKRVIGQLDLRDPKIFNSEYYYLQQNDIVIVDQLKNKQQASDQVTVRNISILATIISTLAIVFSAIRR